MNAEEARKHRKKRLNGCDWYDCNTCPHEDCVSDEEKADRYLEDKHRKDAIRKRRQYDLRKQNHLCVKCGIALSDNRTICDECSRKQSEKYNRKWLDRQKQNRILNIRLEGICSLCRKRKTARDSKLCPECLEKARKSVAKALETQIRNRKEA